MNPFIILLSVVTPIPIEASAHNPWLVRNGFIIGTSLGLLVGAGAHLLWRAQKEISI